MFSLSAKRKRHLFQCLNGYFWMVGTLQLAWRQQCAVCIPQPVIFGVGKTRFSLFLTGAKWLAGGIAGFIAYTLVALAVCF